jgi:hypothetical protein
VAVEMFVFLMISLGALNSWLCWRVLRDTLSSHQQKIAQLLAVWLLPVLGAMFVLHLQQRDAERPSGRYPSPRDPSDQFDLLQPRASNWRHRQDEETPSHGHDSPD